MNIGLSWKIFKKSTNIKFYKNQSSAGELLQADGETDRHGDAGSRFLQFCERAYKSSAVLLCTWSIRRRD
jgi:hypothetical protein